MAAKALAAMAKTSALAKKKSFEKKEKKTNHDASAWWSVASARWQAAMRVAAALPYQQSRLRETGGSLNRRNRKSSSAARLSLSAFCRPSLKAKRRKLVARNAVIICLSSAGV